jgi:hypothetical protein
LRHHRRGVVPIDWQLQIPGSHRYIHTAATEHSASAASERATS